jgi:hypothetical protein
MARRSWRYQTDWIYRVWATFVLLWVHSCARAHLTCQMPNAKCQMSDGMYLSVTAFSDVALEIRVIEKDSRQTTSFGFSKPWINQTWAESFQAQKRFIATDTIERPFSWLLS